MKNILLFTAGLVISFLASSQPKPAKGMYYCPKGTLTRTSDFKTVSVNSFFISNEITNKEFREFYNHIKESPNDTIYWIDYSLVQKENETGKSYVVKKTYKEILPVLIDLKVWEENPVIKNDFFNKKANDYPVIGVTLEGAKYYCIWKTNKDCKLDKNKERYLEMDYRLPFEEEWEYATKFYNSSDNSNNNELKESFSTKEISNLDCNVAEWVVLTQEKKESKNIYKGSSYKTKQGLEERGEISKYQSTDFVGFRIVQTTL